MKLDIQRFAEGKLIIGTEVDTSGVDKGLEEIENKSKDVENLEEQIAKAKEKTAKEQERTKELQEQTAESQKKTLEYEQEIQDIEARDTYLREQLTLAEEMKEKIDSIGDSLRKTVKSTTKWVLAFFGIRGIFGFIKNSMSTITQQDKQLSADIDYMKNAIAYTLEPVVRSIVSLVKQLLFFVQYIVKLITGKDIFANANKSLASANKQAKALGKQLAGFDEMNVLSDSSSGGGGASTPSFDFMQETPDWIKWLADNVAKTLSNAFNTGPIQSFIDTAGKFGNFLVDLFKEVGSNLAENMSLTWGKIKDNFVLTITNMGSFWTLFWQDLGTGIDTWGQPIIDGITELFNGIWLDVIDPFLQIVTKGWADLSSMLLEIWEEYGQPLVDKVGEYANAIIKFFKKIWDDILEPIITPFLEQLSWLWDKHIKGMLKEVGEFLAKLIEYALDLYTKFILPIMSYIMDKLAPVWSYLSSLIMGVFGSILAFITDTVKSILKVLGGILDFIAGVFTGDWKRAWKGIVSIFEGIIDGLVGIFKLPINLIIDGINSFISGINKIKIPDWVPGVGGMGFNIKKIPKLASGGIVNNPGPGVMMGSYIAGERGPEAVIPLDDDTLDRLGLAFARHTQINATVPVYVGNRQIAREIRKINAEDDFAFNV